MEIVIDDELLGIYNSRDLGRDKGIHLPEDCASRYKMYRNRKTMVITLVPVKAL